MRKTWLMLLVSLFVVSSVHSVLGAENGTAAEATAMVKKAIACIKINGRDRAFAEFSNRDGKFNDRDLYIVVYDMNGKCLAHGQTNRLVGKDLIGIRDPDGKAYVRERIDIVKTKGKGWQDYKFSNPLSKKIEPKSMYIEKFEDVIVGCGIYKK